MLQDTTINTINSQQLQTIDWICHPSSVALSSQGTSCDLSIMEIRATNALESETSSKTIKNKVHYNLTQSCMNEYDSNIQLPFGSIFISYNSAFKFSFAVLTYQILRNF